MNKDFRQPWSGISWDNLSVSWGLYKSIEPYDGFSISLGGRMETKEYSLLRDKYSRIRLTYMDSSDMNYTMSQGSFKVISFDSSKYFYEGEFNGRFINEDETDSFDAYNGKFYFIKSF